ncbi:FtsX-like permease family protein [bacterium]|nr:FtsX-like permease family protein [bacterium]
MKFFSLALRNIFRNKRRTTITFLAIISGMIGLIVFGGFVEYSFWGLRESTIRSQLGHLQVYKKGYCKKGIANSSEYLIKNYQELEEIFYKIPCLELVTARLSFSGLISTGEKTLVCKGDGVIPEKEAKLASFETIIEGEGLFKEDQAELVIGRELQKSLGAKIGDYLTILTTTPEGMINAADVKLIGVCQSGSKEYDSVYVKLPLKIVQQLFSTTSVEKIIILSDKTEHTPEIARRIALLFKEKNLNLEFKTWDQLAEFYHSVVRLYNGIFKVVKVIIALIVLFSIANTMTMSVFERIREIGTLRAIGTKKIQILTLFLWEGFLTGVIGAILGMITGIFIATIINLGGGIYIPPPPAMTIGYNALILIVPEVLWYSFISTVIVATISAFYPAFKATRLNIVESLAHT